MKVIIFTANTQRKAAEEFNKWAKDAWIDLADRGANGLIKDKYDITIKQINVTETIDEFTITVFYR